MKFPLTYSTFSTAIAYADGFSQVAKFKGRKTFDDIKSNIAYAFSAGAYEVRLYEDYRKSDCIKIMKTDFSEKQILEGFIAIQNKKRLEFLTKKRDTVVKNMSRNKNELALVESEISELQTLLN